MIRCNATDILAGMAWGGEWEGNGNIVRARTHICPTCMAFLASSSNPGVRSSPRGSHHYRKSRSYATEKVTHVEEFKI